MSNVLVVVYSYTGTSRRVAELLCSQQGWPMGEIAEVRPRHGPLGRLSCILDSVLLRCPPTRYDGPPPMDFDIVVLVTPIWGRRVAGPMRSFVTRRRDHLPDVAVVLVMEDRGAQCAVSEIDDIIDRSPLLSTSITTRQVDEGSFVWRLKRFGTGVSKARDPHSIAWSVNLTSQAA